jgi:hypothetical protein
LLGPEGLEEGVGLEWVLAGEKGKRRGNG